MRGRPREVSIVLADTERKALEKLVRCHTTLNGVAQRARVILRLASGDPLTQVCAEIGMGRKNAYKWIRRFAQERTAGLRDRREDNVGRRAWSGLKN